MNLKDKLDEFTYLNKTVKNSEVFKLGVTEYNLYAKFEFQLFGGSIKARAAYEILEDGINRGVINENTTIIESSSGNFAIAMSMFCKKLGLKFIAVVDILTNPNAIKFLKFFAHEVVVINERDDRGGFLLNRLKYIKEYTSNNKNIYWTNQYENECNYLAHYKYTAEEIIEQVPNLDIIFIGAGTCGTLSGVSRKLKEYNPKIKVVAVDVEGSSIFGLIPKTRFIPGMASSIKPPLLNRALYDEIMIISEEEIIYSCYSLLEKHMIFGGGSCGAVFAAIERSFISSRIPLNSNVLFLCPDGGRFYIDTIYNKEWVKETYNIEI